MDGRVRLLVNERSAPAVNESRHKREGREIPKTTIPNKSGKDLIVYRYRDALNFAHGAGLIGFDTALVPELCDVPGNHYVARAIAHFADGSSWSGIGDANPANVNRMVAAHAPRMAETRAKARALGDALNLDANFADEFGDGDKAEEAITFAVRATPPAQSAAVSCEGCGAAIKDSPNFSADKKADYSRRKYGKVLCYTCGKAAD